VEDNPAEQTQASEYVNQDVAKAGGDSARLAAQPDEERCRHRHELPEQKQRQEISGEGSSKRSTRVRQRSDVLRVVVHVKRVDHPDERDDGEDVRENKTEPVDAAEDELLPQE
jgi:hypothetical protein